MSDGPGSRYCLPKKHEKKQREKKWGKLSVLCAQSPSLSSAKSGNGSTHAWRTPQQINAYAGRASLFRSCSNSFKVRAIALSRTSISASTVPGSNVPCPFLFPAILTVGISTIFSLDSRLVHSL